jgi:hypothetical protein
MLNLTSTSKFLQIFSLDFDKANSAIAIPTHLQTVRSPTSLRSRGSGNLNLSIQGVEYCVKALVKILINFSKKNNRYFKTLLKEG